MHRAVIDHLAKEERVLFPMILEGYGPRTGGPVRVMEMEHDEHRTSLARLHELTHSLIPPPDGSDEWRALYHRLVVLEKELLEHIHLENEVLFPRALVEEQ
jgi:regulator of cell morphogenesis and NO signaling